LTGKKIYDTLKKIEGDRNMKQEKLDEKLYEAIQKRDFAAAGKLIKKGANKSWTYLMKAIDAGDIEQAKFWVDTGINLNQVTNKLTGETFISRAVFKGKQEILELLVDGGADIAFADKALAEVRHGSDINSLLMTSLLNKNLEMMEYLIKRGAKPTAEFIQGLDFYEKTLRVGALVSASKEGCEKVRELQAEFRRIDAERRAKDKEFGQGK